jgi:hypothetical protein
MQQAAASYTQNYDTRRHTSEDCHVIMGNHDDVTPLQNLHIAPNRSAPEKGNL